MSQEELTAELERLRARTKALAEEKAYHQLILGLIERLDPLPGLEDMLRNMLLDIVECIGGTNIKLYYWVEGELNYLDFNGQQRRGGPIDDQDVERVAQTHQFVERRGGPTEALLMHGLLRGSWTWTFPLLVGDELVGVIKLENLHIHGALLGKYLPAFFSHAALILSNEIRSFTRQKAEQALAESEARTRRIIKQVPIALAYVAKGGAVVDLNDRWQQLFGYTRAEVPTMADWWPRAYPDPAYRRQVIEAWTAAVEAAAAAGTRIEPAEYRVTCRGGEVRVIEISGVTLGEDLLATFIDLTERERAEAAVRELNQDLERRVAERTAQLEATNKELEAFAYSVSHDLRAPVRAIDGFRGLLQSRLGDAADAQSRRYLASISDAASRMGQLIDDLLSFSRMGRLELSHLPVDLKALVAEVIEELAPEAGGRAVDWQVGALPVVSGDRAMLKVALGNLLSNALKFTARRERACIEVGARPGEGETVIFVKDNGVGFDPTYAGKLFGVFQRLHRADDFQGTGIGLANVRRIVTRHGGRTWAEAREGEGATFFFSLPGAP